ncbi:MAG: Ldh family oxidoreductase [Pseudomonadota bacterium]
MAAEKIEVSVAEIEQRTEQALLRSGCGAFAASHLARAVAEAEARGNLICGLYYLDSYCTQLGTGRVDGHAQPVVSTPRPGTVQVDAAKGFAQAAFAAGLEPALEAARSNGVATLSIHHSHTCTSMGFFTEQIARAGMIGIGMTNAPACVAPPGGSVPVLGTNPISMAVPDGEGRIAMLFDQSTSATAIGKVRVAASRGEKVPDGWIVDGEGQPTNEPKDMASLVSAGGYKGFGFGLMAEVLAAGLTGSVLSTEAAPLKTPEGPPHDLGQFYILIDPEAFGGGLSTRLAPLMAAVEAQEGARVPGRRKGVPDRVSIDADLWQSVLALSGE